MAFHKRLILKAIKTPKKRGVGGVPPLLGGNELMGWEIVFAHSSSLIPGM